MPRTADELARVISESLPTVGLSSCMGLTLDKAEWKNILEAIAERNSLRVSNAALRLRAYVVG